MRDTLILGCGYLGLRLAARWLADGRRVLATTRRPARAAELRRAGIEPLVCDVTDPDSLDGLPAVATAVWCVGLDRAAGKPMRAVYVDGLAHVLARLPLPGRLLYISSTSVYGQDDGSEVDETSTTDPADEPGRVAFEAETVLRRARPDAVVLRFAGIYGPGRLLRAEAVRAGEPLPGDPDRWLNLIHVDDGVAAVVAAEQRGRPGAVYNVGDGHPVRRGEFFARLAELLAAPPPRFVPPAAAERAHRRVANRLLREELGVALRYPSYEEGLRAAYP
jgi:nucleoside-diphosphate-sugar epimerase